MYNVISAAMLLAVLVLMCGGPIALTWLIDHVPARFRFVIVLSGVYFGGWTAILGTSHMFSHYTGVWLYKPGVF